MAIVHVPGQTKKPAMPPLDPRTVAPAWGWRQPGAGRASYVGAAPEYQATTVQGCGLFPFMAGSGSPIAGVPIGRHQLYGEVVCLDPLEWVRVGLITNPGVFVLGQPGVGKSAITKRLVTGMSAFGTRALILGDLKPEYSPLVRHLGGQVIRVGRGLDRINPLDAGPLGRALDRMSGPAADRLRLEVHGRRLSLLLALCALVRGHGLSNAEEVIIGKAVRITVDKLGDRDPTVLDVLKTLETPTDYMLKAARTTNEKEYFAEVRDLTFTLDLLVSETMAGIFDGPTTTPLNLDAPAVSVDISAVASSDDKLIAAAMLCTWAYGHAMVDAAAVLAEVGLGPRHQFLAVMDELWRALKGTSGLVEHADALTRLNRQRGMASMMITHSMKDLAALPTEEDRNRATGFVERSAITVLAGLPLAELEVVTKIRQLTEPEMHLVKSWASPESWMRGVAHPGRGKYLIKTGDRLGIPVELSLVGDEPRLYDTDAAMRLDEVQR
ncbi:MAG: hypothetical protein ACRER3_00170 [Pseudomonas fluorescens]